MAKPAVPDLGGLARAGGEIAVRVTPRASRNAVERSDSGIRVFVTAVPEGGRANAAVVKLLARALGVPKSSLRLVRGETGRDKVFRILP